MRLSKLLASIKSGRATGFKGSSGGNDMGDDPDITSIHYRSQDVKPGGLFVAIPGLAADGHEVYLFEAETLLRIQ